MSKSLWTLIGILGLGSSPFYYGRLFPLDLFHDFHLSTRSSSPRSYADEEEGIKEKKTSNTTSLSNRREWRFEATTPELVLSVKGEPERKDFSSAFSLLSFPATLSHRRKLSGLYDPVDMILNVWSPAGGNLHLNHKTLKSRSYSSPSATTSHLRANVASPANRNWWPSRGNPFRNLAASSTPLLSGNLGNLSHTIPTLPNQKQRRSLTPRASKDVPYSFRYPAMTTKPKWYWRTLACLPYLMPLHETWMYAETAYHLHPFLEDLEFLTYPFLESLGRLPSWFLMAYFFVAYLGVVRKKEWPHFFRFHVVMGMLLEISLQIVGTVSRWMPLAIYWGKVGMHLWTAIAFAYLFTVLECLRCALAGMYADVPFVCDAAYIQIPYD